jgi:hypothetical protein
MGLKRRNPARNRLFTPPQMLAVLAAAPVSPASAVSEPPAPVRAPASAASPLPFVSHEDRHRLIAVAAYRHAERAGFATDPMANWLLAEREIDAQLSRKAS